MFHKIQDEDNDELLEALITDTPGLRMMNVGHRINQILQFHILITTIISVVLLAMLINDRNNETLIISLFSIIALLLVTIVGRIVFDIICKQVLKKEERDFIKKWQEQEAKEKNNN